MKHNLANKPQLYKIPSDLTEHLKFETQIIEWFEGFEKELRQMLEQSQTNTKKLLLKEKFIVGSETRLQRAMEQAYRLAVEEVLGEASTAVEGSRGG